MQQLNVLPVNVSQNVEIKDDTIAPTTSSSKDGFTQHIDLHLAKNKDIRTSENKKTAENIDAKTNQKTTEKTNSKTNDKDQDISGTSQAMTDETESANSKQEVAASGKIDEEETTVETSGEKDQVIDESELLMSFLNKADKTLIENNSTEVIKLGEMSAELKAKHAAELLLKSSDLVADLSSVAKAVTSSSTVESNDLLEQEKAVESLLTASKTNTEGDQFNTNAFNGDLSLEGKNISNENSDKITKDSGISQQTGTAHLNGKETVDLQSTTIKAEEVIQSKNAQQLDEIIDEIQSLKNTSVESEKITQQALSQQSVNLESKTLGSSKNSALSKSLESLQTMINGQNSPEVESQINEQIAQLIQNENGKPKPENSLASAINVVNNANSNKNLSTANLAQNKAESAVKQTSSVEPDIELTAKSVDHEVEQSRELGVNENKDVKGKVIAKPNTDFAINSAFSDSTSRSTQAAYDRVDQQISELFNPTGSAEVSQGQKTNTQLHQETISIFRKDFSDAVKDKVMLMISQKLQQFDISLDPPELGNMQVRVNLQGEQATVNFIVQNQQAKDALEQNMHKLRDALAEQGVDVGDANVEQQSQQSDKDETSGDNKNNLMTNTADANDVIEHSLSTRMFDSSTTVVDYYA